MWVNRKLKSPRAASHVHKSWRRINMNFIQRRQNRSSNSLSQSLIKTVSFTLISFCFLFSFETELRLEWNPFLSEELHINFNTTCRVRTSHTWWHTWTSDSWIRLWNVVDHLSKNIVLRLDWTHNMIHSSFLAGPHHNSELITVSLMMIFWGNIQTQWRFITWRSSCLRPTGAWTHSDSLFPYLN